jgi:putative RecB family exonuclease
MGTYGQCPKQYHYRYIEKPDVEKTVWASSEFGSCAHRILELFHERVEKEKTSKKDYSILMKQCFVAGVKEFDINVLQGPTWMPDGDLDGIIALRTVIQDYLNAIRENGMPEVIGTELKYSFSIDDTTLVRGFIDRVDRISPGVYRVVDYKTSKNPKYLTEFQLLVYAEALNRVYKDVKEVRGSYILLKHKCATKDFVFFQKDLDRCIEMITEKAESIKTDECWVKKPTVLCGWCDYRAICQDTWDK